MIRNIKLFFIIPLLAFTVRGISQSVSFTASAPAAVQAGEQFQLVYSVNASPSNFSPVLTKDFSVLAGPYSSSSSSTQILNGQMTQSVNISYTYVLQANKEGKYTIPPAKVVVNGKNYNSNAVTIEVVKGNIPATQAQGNSQSSTENNDVSDADNQDLFVRILLDKKDVFVGEPLIATIKIYSRVDISGINNIKNPDFSGFYQQDIETPPLNSLRQENVNGQIYGTGVIQKFLLFPQRSGTLTIKPLEMECIVRKAVQRRSRSVFDDFFGAGYQDVKVNIKSKTLSVKVRELPISKPASFANAVGSIDMKHKLDKNSVKTNEAISLKIELIGNGNLKLIDAPKITFPSDFEIYDPDIKLNIKNSVAGQAGSKSFEWVMIPRHAGEFKIPSIEFTSFNYNTGKYETKSTGDLIIKVIPGKDDEQTTVVASGVSKEDIKMLGKDIRYIKKENIKLRKKGDLLYTNTIYYLTFLLLLLLFIVLIILTRKRIKENANVKMVKNKRANKLARKRLKLAIQALKDNKTELFYEETAKALWGYLSDKLMIPLSELSKDAIIVQLQNKSLNKERIEQLINVIDTCEYARYAPSSEGMEMKQLYDKATEIILGIESNI